jgi:hypothetical protein
MQHSTFFLVYFYLLESTKEFIAIYLHLFYFHNFNLNIKMDLINIEIPYSIFKLVKLLINSNQFYVFLLKYWDPEHMEVL